MIVLHGVTCARDTLTQRGRGASSLSQTMILILVVVVVASGTCGGTAQSPTVFCLSSQLASPDTADCSSLSVKACSNCTILTDLGVRECKPFLEVNEKCMLIIIDPTKNAGVTLRVPDLFA